MPPPSRVFIHHLALTVTDLDRSIPWYEAVFDLKFVMEAPHEGGTGMVLANEEAGLRLVLHRHDANEGERFHETRTGMDHVGLMVPSRDELVRWSDHLVAHGVVRSETAAAPLTQSPIVDEVYGSILVIRDPDNIQLEFIAPPEQAPS